MLSAQHQGGHTWLSPPALGPQLNGNRQQPGREQQKVLRCLEPIAYKPRGKAGGGEWTIQIWRRVGSVRVNSANTYPKCREEGGGTSWWHQLLEQPLIAGGLSTDPFPPFFHNYSSVFLKVCIYSNVERK